jgi:enediyne biosynthesis protein E4
MKEQDEREEEKIEVDLADKDDSIISRALGWSLLGISILTLMVCATVYWVNRPLPVPSVSPTEFMRPRPRDTVPLEIPAAKFTDVTTDARIDFVHDNGADGEKLLPETMGSGCAFFDFDNDGDQDLFFVNSRPWPWTEGPREGPAPTCVLYANDGAGRFEDVSAACGLDLSIYGMGVAVGDYDNDGWVDLFITACGENNRLFRNQQGKFSDVTTDAGVAGEVQQWSTGCGWLDYDNDGDLDLYVCNYVKWSREIDKAQDFRLVGVGRAYGPPKAFEGTFPYLYRNEGNGKFTEVGADAGVQVRNPNTKVPMAKSLAIAPVDLDGDGWIDIVVANDTVQNFVFRNKGNGTFEEVGARIGIAFDSFGNTRGAMGADAARFRNNETLAVAIGNFSNEQTALYVSHKGALQFSDASQATGLGPLTRLQLTFGLFFFDFDLDGRLDLLEANGHLENDINKVQASQQYAQPPQLFWNCGPGQSAEFQRVPAAKCGEEFVQPLVGRGAAYADIDSDGDLDAVLTANGGRARLLRNDQQLGNHWLRVKLVGRSCNRDAIGAWVEVHGAGIIQYHQVMPTRSYLSQSELPLTFGLGTREEVEKVVVRWPDGAVEERLKVPADALLKIEQAPVQPAPTGAALISASGHREPS